MKLKAALAALAAPLLVLLFALSFAQAPPVAAAEDGEGWISLFDGETLEGWEDQGGGPPKGWRVEDGSLYRYEKGGNLHTVETFYDFELEFEWKVGKGVNSGVKYRFHGGVGPEYQVLDDENAKSETKPLGQTAALYVIKEATGKTLHPHGEWNRGRIVAKGKRLEHWLNGVKVVEIEIDSEEWDERKAASKFKDREGFGLHPGPIHLQDHGGEVWFRNLRIRPLD